jgi:hypothetical protein
MMFEKHQPIHYLDQNGKLQTGTIYSGPISSRNNGNRKAPKFSYQVLNRRNLLRKIPLQWILDGQAEFAKQKKGITMEELNEYTRKHILPRANALMLQTLESSLSLTSKSFKIKKEQS